MQPYKELSSKVIGCAIEVHRRLGPGLLESTYEQCLAHELSLNNIPFRQQHPLPAEYKGLQLDCGYRVDLFIDDKIILELKSVDELHGIRFLENMLDVLKTRLVTDMDIKQYNTQLRYIASNIGARIFLHYSDKDSEINQLKCAQTLLECMISIPDAALEILDTLLINGLDFGDIKSNIELRNVALNIYEENLEILKNKLNPIEFVQVNHIKEKISLLSIKNGLID